MKVSVFSCFQHVEATSCPVVLSSLDPRFLKQHVLGKKIKTFFSAWAMPSMTSVGCDVALCLNVNFNDGGDDEVVRLDAVYKGVYSGNFRDGTAMAVSNMGNLLSVDILGKHYLT